jgi:uroporphyrinogen-III decarboxylase
MATRSRRDYVHRVFERQCEIGLANLARIHAVVGDNVDAVYVCGTDFGTQKSAFCSVDSFNDLWLPYYRAVNGWVHRHTTWKTFKHSCGSVARFYPSFIEAGFDIVNPIQCSAAGMDPEVLKSTFGDRLVFWGGGVDTQETLPFGAPAQVRDQVCGRLEIFAPGGGYVFNTVHNIQAQTPVKNVVAMLEAIGVQSD